MQQKQNKTYCKVWVFDARFPHTYYKGNMVLALPSVLVAWMFWYTSHNILSDCLTSIQIRISNFSDLHICSGPVIQEELKPVGQHPRTYQIQELWWHSNICRDWLSVYLQITITIKYFPAFTILRSLTFKKRTLDFTRESKGRTRLWFFSKSTHWVCLAVQISASLATLGRWSLFSFGDAAKPPTHSWI